MVPVRFRAVDRLSDPCRRNPALPRAVGMTKQASREKRKAVMNSIIYLVGLVVVVLFILSLLGLR